MSKETSVATADRRLSDEATRKVVINACYGGFGLSPAGEIAYLARQGKTAFFYEHERTEDGRPDFDNYHRLDDPNEAVLFSHTLTEDLGANPTGEELNASEAWFSGRDIKRDDPDLLAVLDELGGEANGRFAKLQVVEIPADVDWAIEEYDGYEHVAEVHRTWPA